MRLRDSPDWHPLSVRRVRHGVRRGQGYAKTPCYTMDERPRRMIYSRRRTKHLHRALFGNKHKSLGLRCELCKEQAVFHWITTYPDLLLCRDCLDVFPEAQRHEYSQA